jgi:hypothetical protein
VTLQKTPVSSAKKSNNISKQQISDETLYAKGSYVAFIDASDSLEKFKVAYVSVELIRLPSYFCLIFREI